MKQEICDAILRKKEADGLSQIELAKAMNISQSQVSRILAGQFFRESRAVKTLCEYASYRPRKRINPASSELLMGALKRTWDGSKKHEKALAKVIQSLADFPPPSI